MHLPAYSIFDKKVGSYYRPTFVKSPVEIQRNLQQVMKSKDSSLALYPADFAVYKVGSFDDELGIFVVQTKPEFFCEVLDFTRPPSDPFENFRKPTQDNNQEELIHE